HQSCHVAIRRRNRPPRLYRIRRTGNCRLSRPPLLQGIQRQSRISVRAHVDWPRRRVARRALAAQRAADYRRHRELAAAAPAQDGSELSTLDSQRDIPISDIVHRAADWLTHTFGRSVPRASRRYDAPAVLFMPWKISET